MSLIDGLHRADLETADLGRISAWCLDRLAERMADAGTLHESAEVLSAVEASLASLNDLYSQGSCNTDQEASSSLGLRAALDLAAVAAANLVREHERAAARLHEQIRLQDHARPTAKGRATAAAAHPSSGPAPVTAPTAPAVPLAAPAPPTRGR